MMPVNGGSMTFNSSYGQVGKGVRDQPSPPALVRLPPGGSLRMEQYSPFSHLGPSQRRL